MLKYLVIQLDDSATSYCHYENTNSERNLIPIEILKGGILFGMKENLMIQYIFPEYELPLEYLNLIDSIDNSKIASSGSLYAQIADVVVLNGWDKNYVFTDKKVYVIRIDKSTLFEKYNELIDVLKISSRLNIVITDIDGFDDADFDTYKSVLRAFGDELQKLYINGLSPQLNLLTDRMMLDEMNNCNAGSECITLAPDGNFYVCPAFYVCDENEDYGLGYSKFSIGSLATGLDIKNAQLYKLSHAPICRNCDAYQCRRCVWLNRKTTYEINTPSREQCVVAHMERNASRDLLMNIRKQMVFLPDKEDIKDISYLDPYDARNEL